jgi:hypothetical protein
MKKPSRLKTPLSLLLVSVLAATIMPTSVNAETTDFEDNEVTVEVDLGSEGPDPELCEGFASLTVPGETIPATLNRRVNGNSDPSMADLLGYYWGEYSAYDQIAEELYDDEDLQSTLNSLNNVGGPDYNWNAVKNPVDATLDTLVSISYQPIISNGNPTEYRSEDIDQDGDIDINDAPEWITETRRSYSTDWFTISYDANDCLESDDVAVVMVTRTPTLRSTNDGAEFSFFESELTWEDSPYDVSVEGKSEAYLKIRTNLIGGLVSLPYEAAWDPITDFANYDSWDVDPVAFGDEGSAEMRSMMNIYGASPTGIYQANYYYQLEVNDEEYFFDEFGYFGCLLGGCG